MQVLAVARHKGLWFAVSMGCYMIGVGGMIYCIIRNPKAHGFHQVCDVTIAIKAVTTRSWGRRRGGAHTCCLPPVGTRNSVAGPSAHLLVQEHTGSIATF